ncbi:MAG: hypothetical protein JXR39_08610 [Marinilabiliaceae bacterium]|nr:hypothetical protein [Marinilabiliaceae bacterium]
MIYTLRIISNESDDFIREVTIDGEDNFLTLHNFLQQEMNYDPSMMASFFTTDEGWNKETEITLMDMMDGENPDIRVMDQCVIADYVHSNKQRFLYVFDFFAERAFFMEICNIQNGSIPAPQIIKSEGDAPEQIMPDLMADNGDPDSDLLDVEDEADDFFKYEEGIDEDVDLDSFGMDFREDY